MNILLMKDDPVLSDILLDFLREEWHVDYAYSSQEVYEQLENTHYDLFKYLSKSKPKFRSLKRWLIQGEIPHELLVA